MLYLLCLSLVFSCQEIDKGVERQLGEPSLGYSPGEFRGFQTDKDGSLAVSLDRDFISVSAILKKQGLRGSLEEYDISLGL